MTVAPISISINANARPIFALRVFTVHHLELAAPGPPAR